MCNLTMEKLCRVKRVELLNSTLKRGNGSLDLATKKKICEEMVQHLSVLGFKKKGAEAMKLLGSLKSKLPTPAAFSGNTAGQDGDSLQQLMDRHAGKFPEQQLLVPPIIPITDARVVP